MPAKKKLPEKPQIIEVGFAGETFEYDPNSLLMSELSEIKRVTGMGRREWNEALVEEDVEAVVALIYVLRKRRGDDVRLSDVDGPWSSFFVRVKDATGEGDATPPLEAVS